MAYDSSAQKRLTAQMRLVGGFESVTLSDDLTLDSNSANYLRIDPGGSARDVSTPAAAVSDGLFFWVYNIADAAENVVLKDAAGSTLLTLGQGACGMIGCDGTEWKAYTPVLSVDTDT